MPLRMRSRASRRRPHNRRFFLSVGELHLPRASSAPPPDVALPRPLVPRPPTSPFPSLPVCVSDPKAVRGGGTVGGAAAASSLAPAPAAGAAAAGTAAAGAAAAAAVRRHRICLQPGEGSPQSGPAPLSGPRSSALGSAFHSASRGSAAGGKAAGFAGACVQPVLAPPPRPWCRRSGSSRRAELAFRPPAVVR